ncbi:MAG: AMP-binding protein, partial [Actinomycetota bacterium]
MTPARERSIEALLDERRVIDPSPEFRKHAVVSDEEVYAAAASDPDAFWAEQARRLEWVSPPTKVLEWTPPWVRWFADGVLNVSVNCVDRHAAATPDRVAYYFEGEPGDRRAITYAELHAEVCRFANALRASGVGKGDRVAIYMGMVPELPVAMLACTRIGAPHSVVFGGFSSDALRDRIEDAQAKLLITCDGGWRRGQVVPLKQNADEAVAQCPSIERVVVVRRTGTTVPFDAARDVWWDEFVAGQPAVCEPEPMGSEDPLYILYTSGTTGKPKGILHTTGGYLVGVTATHRMIFDVRPEEDAYWCAADIGWVTGHSYIVYGPLSNGTTSILYEGAPDHPGRDRWWEIVERYGATILYTAPTAIRTFMKWGTDLPRAHDLS